ncbi:MAG: hypothetical protein A4E43_00560 [Methanosaeta sp. PtaB.Bin005]|nr:MAG: hypothetical protein A4E43_00560 [Methanosaeta sp. PtaB.Bin005]
MFSTMPSMGTFIIRNMLTALRESRSATSCGVVTTIAPSRPGMSWAMLMGSSLVPGGRSTKRKSSSPQLTSSMNCFKAAIFMGPRQTTGESRLFRSRAMEMALMPPASAGSRPDGPATSFWSSIPRSLGISGPVISPSRIPTL